MSSLTCCGHTFSNKSNLNRHTRESQKHARNTNVTVKKEEKLEKTKSDFGVEGKETKQKSIKKEVEDTDKINDNKEKRLRNHIKKRGLEKVTIFEKGILVIKMNENLKKFLSILI